MDLVDWYQSELGSLERDLARTQREREWEELPQKQLLLQVRIVQLQKQISDMKENLMAAIGIEYATGRVLETNHN